MEKCKSAVKMEKKFVFFLHLLVLLFENKSFIGQEKIIETWGD